MLQLTPEMWRLSHSYPDRKFKTLFSSLHCLILGLIFRLKKPIHYQMPYFLDKADTIISYFEITQKAVFSKFPKNSCLGLLYSKPRKGGGVQKEFRKFNQKDAGKTAGTKSEQLNKEIQDKRNHTLHKFPICY